MDKVLVTFKKFSVDIESLWLKYSGYNPKIDKEYQKLDSFLEMVKSNPENLSIIENYMRTSKDNYFEQLLFSRIFVETDSEKTKKILEKIAEKDSGKAGFLAKSALLNL